MDEPILDCLIVGGGPAGLTAAIYLARFHLDILVVDGGKSRAAWIPCTRNHAGFPDGISGDGAAPADARAGLQIWREDRERVRHQARARRDRPACSPRPGDRAARSRAAVLLATGVTNRRPPMDEELHDDALARGLVRYCPICDGYEVTDKKVGVIGSDSHGVAEALFLRSFTADVTLIAPDKAMRLKPEDHEQAESGGDRLRRRADAGGGDRQGLYHRRHRRGPLHLRHHLSGARLRHPHPTRRNGRRRLSARIAASTSTATSAPASPDFMPPATSCIGLDQISHAMGEGGVAATTIRNDLARRSRAGANLTADGEAESGA